MQLTSWIASVAPFLTAILGHIRMLAMTNWAGVWVLVCGALALASVPPLVYLLLRRRLHTESAAECTLMRAEFSERIAELNAELGVFQARLAECEARPGTLGGWPAEPVALNLNRRGQILRLHGKGRTAAEIAADLGTSQGEVELSIKLQDLPAPGLKAAARTAVL